MNKNRIALSVLLFAFCLSLFSVCNVFARYTNSEKFSLDMDIDARYFVTFDGNKGRVVNVSESALWVDIATDKAIKTLEVGYGYGDLPSAERRGYTFQGWGESVLPLEYKQVEYIELKSGAYINTGIIVKDIQNPTVDCTFYMMQSGDYDWFGTLDNSAPTILWNFSPPSTPYMRWGATSSNSNQISYQPGYNASIFDFTDGFHHLHIGDSAESLRSDVSIYVDDILVGIMKANDSRTLTSAKEIVIGRGRTNGNSAWKRFKVYNGTECVGDFIPCYTMVNNQKVFGMYDAVGKLFHGNATNLGSISGGNSASGSDDYIVINSDTPMVRANDHTVMACWTPNVYKLFLNGNNCGSTEIMGLGISELDVTYDALYDGLPEISKKGYDFLGWYDTENKRYTKDSIVDIIENTTVLAKWQPKTYKLSFDKNGGEYISSTQGSVVFDSKYILPEVSRKGYVLEGWKAELTDRYKEVEYITLPNNVYIDTGVVVNTLKIPTIDTTFRMDVSGDNDWFGTVDVSKETILYNFSPPTTSYVRWGTTANSGFSVVTYEEGISNFSKLNFTDGFHNLRIGDYEDGFSSPFKIFVDGNQIATIEAGSRSLNHTGTILVGKGRTSVKNSWKSFTIIDGTETKVDLIPCYDTEDKVYGMYDLVHDEFHPAQGTGEATGGPYVFSGELIHAGDTVTVPRNQALYASWKHADFNLILYANDDDGPTYAEDWDEDVSMFVDINTTYDDIPKPKRSGYRLVGWKDEDEVVHTLNESFDLPSGSVLYAQWEPEKYNLKFMVDGIEFAEKEVVFNSVIDDFPVPESTDGRTFVGWRSGLPDGYNRIEYLKTYANNTGDCSYIDTGIVISDLTNPTIETEYRNDAGGDVDIFGSLAGTDKKTIMWDVDMTQHRDMIRWGTSSDKLHIDFVDESMSNYDLEFLDDFHVLRVGDTDSSVADEITISKDGRVIGHVPPSDERQLIDSGHLVIGRGRAGGSMDPCKASWKSFKLWDGDILLCNLVPCYDINNDALGMYDLVEGSFHGDPSAHKGNTFDRTDLDKIMKSEIIIKSGDPFNVAEDCALYAVWE